MGDELAVAQLVREWSLWQLSPSTTVRREILNSIIRPQPDLVTVVQGVRRCGKSTLLTQFIDRFQLNPQLCFFANFEDPRISDRLDPALLDQIVTFGNSVGSANSDRYYFFDEIQSVTDWPKWFHRELAKSNHHNHFIITGSNARMLSGAMGSALTGRHLTVELFPYSLHELREAKQNSTFEEYVLYGGFPRAVTFPEPHRLLREYFNDIIERDVRRTLSLSSPTVLFQLTKLVFSSLGSEVSQRSLASTLGISPDTAGAYLQACEAAYLIQPCPYFSFSERQRVARNRKYYPIDLGLRAATITKGGADRGKELEAAVYLHLRKRYSQVCYWRQSGEVDFVVQDGTTIIPHQITWDGAQERHHKALAEFKSEFVSSSPAVIVTRENVEAFLEARI